MATEAQPAADKSDFNHCLGSLRVVEIGNELGEYCGKVLAGLGADFVRIEKPGNDDPQLRHLGWLTELRQTEIGIWRTGGLPVHLSETPAHVGGRLNRASPNYAEDNDYVVGRILKRSPEQIREMEVTETF